MTPVRAVAVPPDTLLHAAGAVGAYVDCYAAHIGSTVTQAAFVEAFYTSWLFKIERGLLGLLASKPASDDDARRLARGQARDFSAWRVEARGPDQLLLADFTGRTKSWLMVAAVVRTGAADGERATELHFGSAVMPRRGPRGHPGGMGAAFHLLLGFHRLYSRLLLAAARARLARGPNRSA